MVNKPRNKGTSAESMVVEYLQGFGWPYAERRALTGSVDLGDITGCPGIVWEVKNAGSGIRMGQWIGETLDEKRNAKADHAVLVIKPRGLGKQKVDQFLAVFTGAEFDLLKAKAPEHVALTCDEPKTYRRDTVVRELREYRNQFGALNLTTVWTAAIVRIPPGWKENSNMWYYIMTLGDAALVLRHCGYGDPLYRHCGVED